MPPIYVTVYNPGDQPVVVDDAGHTVGGHEWGTALSIARLDDLVAAGHIIIVNNIPDSQVDDAVAEANGRTEQWNDLAGRWANVDDTKTSAAAAANGIDGGDLVDELVRAGAEPPSTSTSRRRSNTEEK